MTIASAAELNDRYAIAEKLQFSAIGAGLIAANITNTLAKATVCLQGAQLLHWQPVAAKAPVIWMSADAQFAPGKSIRGGIPVCWPWFGAHSTNETFPAHGLARTQNWQVKGTRTLEDGSTELGLSLPLTDTLKAMWPHQCQLDILINVGETLKIALMTRNLGASDVTITEALHTYFVVGDVAQVAVEGLDSVHFHDKAAGWTQGDQIGAVTFPSEVDRVYVNSPQRCSIIDAGLKRQIHISKLGSQSTIVWNPAAQRAAQMGDLGQEGWQRFVCVESGNALDNAVTVAAGQSHTLAVEYRVEDLAEPR